MSLKTNLSNQRSSQIKQPAETQAGDPTGAFNPAFSRVGRARSSPPSHLCTLITATRNSREIPKPRGQAGSCFADQRASAWGLRCAAALPQRTCNRNRNLSSKRCLRDPRPLMKALLSFKHQRPTDTTRAIRHNTSRQVAFQIPSSFIAS